MFTAKSAFTLFAIAAGGFINTGNGLATAPSAAAPGHSASPAAVLQVGPQAEDAGMRRAAESALLAAVRHDLDDSQARVRLTTLEFQPSSGRSMDGHGKGFVLFDAVTAIPIEVNVSYDLDQQRVETSDYHVTGNAVATPRAQLGSKLRQRIADRIGARLVLEFSQQPVDFSLLEINQVASSRNRMVVSGNGITRFPGEGAAYTRFVATADKFSGEVLNVKYELLQEMDEAEATPIASID
jgi:hypothetical protein